MKRSINWTFLGILMVGTVLLGGGVHLLHGYQVRRNCGALLEQAYKEKESNPRKAIDYLDRYLRFEPKDTDARAEFGMLKDDQLRKQVAPAAVMQKALREVYWVYDEVLRQDDKRDAIRRRLVDVAMAIGRFEEAKASLDVLLKKTDDAAELKLLMGQCEELNKKYAEAETWYKQAARDAKAAKKPDYHAYYVDWANLTRTRLDKPGEADDIMDEMVQADPACVPARLRRAAYLLDHKLKDAGALDKKVLKKVEDDVKEAAKRAPNDSEPVLLEARLAEVQKKTEEARQILANGIKAHPKSERLYVALANIDVRERKLDDALDVVRRGFTENPESGELALWLADLLLQKGDLKEAEATLNRVRDKRSDPLLVRVLQARLHMQRSEWSKAEPLLLELTTQPNTSALIQKETHRFLGLCYEHLGNPDQALHTYKEAVKLNPVSAAARFGLVRVYHALGRPDEALHECRQLAALPSAPVDAELMLVRLLLSRNLRVPPRNRNWDEVQSAWQKAAKVLPEAADIPILQAQIWLLADPKSKDKALRLLTQARQKAPESARLWVAEAALLGRDKADEGLKLLAEAAKQPTLDDRPLLTLAQIELTVRLPGEQARLQLSALERALAKEPATERSRLLHGLVNGYFRAGDNASAERLLEELAKEQPQNLVMRMVLFDLAAKDNNEPRQRRWLDQIHEIEGDRGSLWRMGEAIAIVNRVRPKDDAKVAATKVVATETFFAARKLLDEVRRKRPSWHMVPALEGEIADLEGRLEQSLSHYQQAFTLGDRRPLMIRRLVQLHLKKRNYPEVEQIVRKLIVQEETLLSAGLGKVASMALLQEDKSLALELAIKVSEKSTKHSDHLWFGQMLRALGKEDEAEKALTDARDLGKKEPETWIALVYFLVAANRPKDAEKEIAKAAAELPEEKRDVALAACYEGVGKSAEAEKHFLADVSRKPRDLDAMRNMANFYLRHRQGAKAEHYLKKIMDAPETPVAALAQARRDLALILAGRGSDDAFNKGLDLIRLNLELSKADRADLRARAALWATRPQYRRDAIRLYEELDRSQSLEAHETFTLARLYDADNNWPKAEATLQLLLGSAGGKDPAYPFYYASRLLGRGDTRLAEVWIEQFAKLRPDPLQLAELRAWVLRSQEKHDQAVTLVSSFSDKKEADLGAIGRILHRLGTGPKAADVYRRKAEEIYRLDVKQTQSQASLLALGNFLTEQNRFAEALDCLEQAFAKGEPEPAAELSVGLLRLRNVPAEHHSRVERWLHDAARKKPDSPRLQATLAELYDLQEKYSDAIAVYQRLIANKHVDTIILNNLAWLRAFHEQQPADALKLIQQAIDLAGPEASLLDTRGVILMKIGKMKEAIADLKRAAAENTAGAYFHLAQAHWQTASSSAAALAEARDAFQKAEAAGLSEDVLHALERADYRVLRKRLKSKRL